MLSRWVRWPAVVLNFYAPWCPWCQRLEPTWEAVVTEVHTRYPESDGRIRMGKVDCTIEVELCRQHHITGFPSIRVFRKGSDDVTVHGVREHESYKGAFCEWAYRHRVYRLVQVTGFRSMAFHEHESYKGRRPRNSAAPCPPPPFKRAVAGIWCSAGRCCARALAESGDASAGDRTKEALLEFAEALVPSAGQPHRYIRGVTRIAKSTGCNLSGGWPRGPTHQHTRAYI